MLKGPLKEPLALPTKDAANEPIIYPKPIEEFEGIRSLIENVVVAFLNPRSIGRGPPREALGRGRLRRALVLPLVQVGQPSVTIYAFQARVGCGRSYRRSHPREWRQGRVRVPRRHWRVSRQDVYTEIPRPSPLCSSRATRSGPVVAMGRSENGPYHMTCANI